ncbi:SDR family oxidoreductase [Daejeonella sp.]|uniref:SDR family oxidoreductase n=1 Tax=Daejeonella sp. TaxID=2805397 RepID=UPI0025BEA79D|nr:SDR family oxidoreductase [Daejeonella sp.]
MKKTILITGTSSGIGKSTVFEFAKMGWNVIATQRNPEKESDFNSLANVKLYALDVTNLDSITQTLSKVHQDYGKIDVIVNNAGYGVDGVFEVMSDEVIEKQFNTNVFGLMRVTREAIKLMRPAGGGTIIQISSMGGKITFPLYSIYHATKFAVEGFTESLHYELAQFNIKMKLIEPGPIVTDFYGRSRQFIKPADMNIYDNFIEKFNDAAAKVMKDAEGPDVVAKMIYKAASDNTNQMRYAVGKPGPLLLKLRKLLSDKLYFLMVRKSYNL